MSNGRCSTPTELQLSRPSRDTDDLEITITSDNSERFEVISKLSRYTDGQLPGDAVNLNGASISLEPGSSLHEHLSPAIDLLKKMTAKETFKRIMVARKVPKGTPFHVTSDGQITAQIGRLAQSFTSAVKLDPDLDDDLQALAEIATLLGGRVSFEDSVALIQWLKFHEFTVPGTKADADKLIAFLSRKSIPSPTFATYWEMLSGDEQSPSVLMAAERAHIRALSKSYISGSRTLLDHLSQIALGERLGEIHPTNADEMLQVIASDKRNQQWARRCIAALAWYGAEPGQSMDDHYVQQMLLTAVLLDLHPAIGEKEPRNHVAGFNLHAPEHVEQPLYVVHRNLEKHLIRHCNVTAVTAPLAAHLLLAGAAPQFLVLDAPPSLRLGTPAWVELSRAVALAEFKAPGSSRLMTYKQLMEQLAMEGVSEPLKNLNSLLAVDPLIDWALINNIITSEQINTSYKESISIVASAYEKYANSVAEVAKQLSTPFPTRREMARDLLKRIAPDCGFLEDEILSTQGHHLSDHPIDALSMSMVELQMSDHLSSGVWDIKLGPSIYKTYPDLKRGATSNVNFSRVFDETYRTFTQAMASHLKLSISTLPKTDRARLLKGQLTFFTLRPSVAVLPSSTPDFAFNSIQLMINTAAHLAELSYRECQRDKDAATGRYGVVVCSYFNNRLYCYELFTLHGQCRENPELAELIRSQGLLNQPARLDFSGSMSRYGTPAAIRKLPTDIECYTHGVHPLPNTTSVGIIEKLGELAPLKKESSPDLGYYQSFYSGEFDNLVNFALQHRPVATYDELRKECWGETKLERLSADMKDSLNTVLNIIVPFKSCIEEALSDDPDDQRSAVQSCTLEVAMTLLLLVGTVAKIATIATRSVSVIAKTASIAKAGVVFLHSLLNPLDGLPDLLRGGAKLLNKGVLRLGKGSVNALENATFQLRRLNGSAQSYDLIKAANRADTGLGTWRPLASSTDSFIVLATRQNDQWYALNRLGQPVGPKLKNFDFLNAFRLPGLHKIMPAAYTRKLLKDALPVARQKVDDAIRVLTDVASERDSGLALKWLMGDNSAEARITFLTALQDIKLDLAKITPDNFIIDTHNKSGALAALNTDYYKDWKDASEALAARKKFIRIFSKNFNRQYRKEGFTSTVPADDLIHEIFHGAPKTDDHAYANVPRSDRLGNEQRLDVSPLMNLASGKFRDMKTNRLLDKSQAFDNADSFAVTTSLLSQASSDHLMFLENLTTLQRSAERNPGHYIGWEVVLNFNPV